MLFIKMKIKKNWDFEIFFNFVKNWDFEIVLWKNRNCEMLLLKKDCEIDEIIWKICKIYDFWKIICLVYIFKYYGIISEGYEI